MRLSGCVFIFSFRLTPVYNADKCQISNSRAITLDPRGNVGLRKSLQNQLHLVTGR